MGSINIWEVRFGFPIEFWHGRRVNVFDGDGFQLAVAEPAGADLRAKPEDVGFACYERRTGGGGVEGEGGGV